MIPDEITRRKAEQQDAMAGRASVIAAREECARLRAELDRERHMAWLALGALEVDSEWSADRLLDAIEESIALLKGDHAGR